MGYQGFWGMTVLTLILLGHGVYVWRKESKDRELVEVPSRVKVFFGVLGGLCAAGFVCGVVMVLCRVAGEVVHVAGLAMLGMAFVLNNQVRKFAPLLVKKEEQEEENHE